MNGGWISNVDDCANGLSCESDLGDDCENDLSCDSQIISIGDDCENGLSCDSDYISIGDDCENDLSCKPQEEYSTKVIELNGDNFEDRIRLTPR